MELVLCRTGHFNHKFLLVGQLFQIQIYTAIYTCICVSLAAIHWKELCVIQFTKRIFLNIALFTSASSSCCPDKTVLILLKQLED